MKRNRALSGLAVVLAMLTSVVAALAQSNVTITGSTPCTGTASYSQTLTITGLPPGCVAALSGSTINITNCGTSTVTVSLTCPQQQLALGTNMTCTATVGGSSNTNVNWTSSNTAAVSVNPSGSTSPGSNNATVTALALGVSTITATAQADATMSAVFNVQAVTPPTAIQIEAESTKSSNYGIITQHTKDVGGGQQLVLSNKGQYWDYPVNLPSAGNYTIAARLSVDPTITAGAVQIHFEMPAGTPITPTIATTSPTWTTVNSSQVVAFSSTTATIRLYCDALPTATAPYKAYINWFQLIPSLSTTARTTTSPNVQKVRR
jgi:hypothetical protein